MNVRVLLAAVSLLLVAACHAQSYCPNCGRVHAATTYTSQPSYSNDSIALAESRRRAAGLGPLSYDASLMRGAYAKASRAAAMGARGHIGGSFYGASKEGVGWSTSRSANACYLLTAPAGTRAGVAVVRGRGGWYTCLLIDYPGRLASGSSRGRFRLFR